MLKLWNFYFKDISGAVRIKTVSLNRIIKLLMMLLMSCCGLGNKIKSTVLIGATTQNVGYAKSLLQGRLNYLSATEVEFCCLM